MKIDRLYTTAGKDPFTYVEWAQRQSKVQNVDGSLVSEMANVEAPADWSQMSVDICVTKYFRKAGVPSDTEHSSSRLPPDVKFDHPLPLWLHPSVPAYDAIFGSETSVRQVVHRIVGCWTYWGFISGYFNAEDDQVYGDVPDEEHGRGVAQIREDNARAFYDECVYALLAQDCPRNTAQYVGKAQHPG